MIYEFRCINYHGIFEVEQPLMAEHEANCPVCGKPAERIFSPLPHTWKKGDFHEDGSRDLNPDLPHVPEGTKWTHGWSPKEED